MSTGTSNYPKVTCIRSSESLTSKSQICRMLTNFLQSEKDKLEVHPRHCMYWQDLLQLTATLATSNREKRKLADLQPTDPFAVIPTSPTVPAGTLRSATDAVVPKEEEQLISSSSSSSSSPPAPITQQEPAATIKQDTLAIIDHHKDLAKVKEGTFAAKTKEEEKEAKKARKAAKKALKEAKKAKKEAKKRKHENL